MSFSSIASRQQRTVDFEAFDLRCANEQTLHSQGKSVKAHLEDFVACYALD